MFSRTTGDGKALSAEYWLLRTTARGNHEKPGYNEDNTGLVVIDPRNDFISQGDKYGVA
jgi:hypothetical protein